MLFFLARYDIPFWSLRAQQNLVLCAKPQTTGVWYDMYKIPKLTKYTRHNYVPWDELQIDASLHTSCRRRLPLRKATSCSRAMHLSHAEVGFRNFLQCFFAVTCHSSWSAMQVILPMLALSHTRRNYHGTESDATPA